MFKGIDFFKNVSCPNDNRCLRQYCPFKHSPAPQVPIAAPATQASSSRALNLDVSRPQSKKKLPSYAPQNSPMEPKVTVDYKQLLRGCKSYKSPHRDAKPARPNNLFEKFKTPAPSTTTESSQPSKNVKAAVSLQPPLERAVKISNSNDAKTEMSASVSCQPPTQPCKLSKEPQNKVYVPQQKSSSHNLNPAQKRTLSPKPKQFQTIKFAQPAAVTENSFSPKTKSDSSKRIMPSYNDDSNNKKSEPSHVYKPGVGILSSPPSKPPDEQVSRPIQSVVSDAFNNSLDFHDPYNSIPETTSPSKVDENESFSLEYQPFQSVDTKDRASSPEDDSQNSDLATKVIYISSSQESADDPSLMIDASETEPEAEKATDVKQDIPSDDETKDDEVVQAAEKPPKRHWLDNLEALKEESYKLEHEVFGTQSPTKKFRKTFGRKKSSDIKITEKDGDDDLVTELFKKDLEEQTALALESPSKSSVASSIMSTQSSRRGSDNDSDDSSESNRKYGQSDPDTDTERKFRIEKERKLEEIKNLKAKIFIKQMQQRKVSSSSESSSSSSSSSGSSNSGESGEENEWVESSNIAQFSSNNPNLQSDSDFSINSEESVLSDEEPSADATTESDSSETTPKRKRKRYASPVHGGSSAATKLLKPVLALTPKQIYERAKHQRSKHSSKNRHSDKSGRSTPQIQPPLRRNQPHHIQMIEVPEQKRHRDRQKPHSESKDRSQSRKSSKLKRKHSKPGVNASVRPDQIIPHQKKLSVKKARILDQYDNRMKNDNMLVVSAHVTKSNTDSFYKRSGKESSKAKYKKEDLSHFDLPPPDPHDPHRYGRRKNKGKRVAHRPNIEKKYSNETKPAESKPGIVHKGGPRIDISARTHVPANVRQTRLDFFITEYLKIWPEDRERAFAESEKDELSCLNRCTTKQLYINVCTNNVKKIRDRAKTNGSEKKSVPAVVQSDVDKQSMFHKALDKYKLNKVDLTKNLYPGYYDYKPILLDGLHCVRCTKLFQLDAEGEYSRHDRCLFHNGRLRTKRIKGFRQGDDGVSKIYDCCDQEDGSMGCAVHDGHVFHIAYLNREHKYYVKTRTRDFSPSVWGLDCEMCYTAGGLELVRLTVVDFNGNTALDMLVKPDNKILDYNTRYSGITAKDLANVKHSLDDAQRAVSRLISADCYIIGHSLESDLQALQMIHKNIVDTSILYFGGEFKRGLATLSAEVLGRIIQSEDSGHDSTEDAVAALDLVKHKLRLTDNIKL